MIHLNPLVIDLSHYDPAHDYRAVKSAGYVGVILKATQGTSSLKNDDQYHVQRLMAHSAGLKVGSYHFIEEAEDAVAQAEHYLSFAQPTPDECFACDWEEYASNTATVQQAVAFMNHVEDKLQRPGQCRMYGPVFMLKQLYDPQFRFGARKTWPARYGPEPVLPRRYWLWQFTDGEHGFAPHSVPGVGRCDINHYPGTPEQLESEWTI